MWIFIDAIVYTATHVEIVIIILTAVILARAELADRVTTMLDLTHALATLGTLELTA